MSKTKDAKWFTSLVKTEIILTKTIRWLCTGWYAALILMMILQVFTRFILKAPLPWTDEAGRYLWATLCFIGCGAAITDDAHIEINIIGSILKGIKDEAKKFKMAQIVDAVRFIAMIGIAGILAYLTTCYMLLMKQSGQVTAAMEFPVWAVYALFLFGFISVIFHSFCRLIITIVDHERIIDPIIIGGDE